MPAIQTVSKTPTDANGSRSAAPATGAQPNQAASNPYELPQPEPTQEEAMSAVLADLEAIGAIDPAAREALMEDLRAAKLSNWPLIVQSFRAALAYREQLIVRESVGSELADDSRPAARLSDRATEARGRAVDRPVQAGSITPLPQTENAPGPDRAPSRVSAENPLREAHHDSFQEPQALAPSPPNRSRAPIPTSRTLAANDLGERAGERGQEPVPPRRPTPNPSPEDGGGGFRPAAYSLAVPAGPADPFESTAAGRLRQGKWIDGQANRSNQSWQKDLDASIGQLELLTKGAPSTGGEVRKHALLRMLYLVADRREDALRPIPGIAPAQQDYWSKQLFALATYLDADGPADARRRATAAQTQLTEAAAILGELGSLSVHQLTFCTDVSGFGVYTPINEPQFSPGQRILLYAEVRNYRSVQTENGYRTVLSTSYAVLDQDGQRVAGGEFPEVEDDCRNRRRDFHIQYGVVLPSDLPSGRYRLELIIQDVLGNKIGRSRTDFEIK